MQVGRRDFLGSAACAVVALKDMASPVAERTYSGAQNQRWRGDIPPFEPPYRHSLRRQFGAYSHDDAGWYKLRDGLDFARIRVYSDGRPVDSLAVVRADPERNRFRAFFDGKRLKTVERWQEATGADIMFNSGYYDYGATSTNEPELVPSGLIISDGITRGPKTNEKARGMFVAEPRDSRRPRARIIDMARESYDWRENVWGTGVQSWPMLHYADGRVGVNPSNWYANRTAICDDKDGNILAITTEGGFFSLHQLGRFLDESRLGIRNALNLDGGPPACMAVKTPRLQYATYGQWVTQDGRDISFPGARAALPGIVGIFPRNR